MLGDYGADVLKVELPVKGDDTRAYGPPFVAMTNGAADMSTYFLALNRNKRSISLDLKNSSGRSVLEALVSKCDVLVENFVPGKLEELGLGYDKLSKINPALVYCSISGFGNGGPDKQRAGYDVIVAGIGGLLSITGPRNGPPVKVGIPVTDMCTGLYAHGAIMAALLSRQHTKLGQKIDCSLLESQVAMLSTIASACLNGGTVPERTGTEHESIVPYQLFSTKDSSIVIGALNNKQFVELCTIINREDLAKDPRFASNPKRVKHRATLIPILSQAFADHPTTYWLDRLQGSELPYGPVNSLPQVFAEAQVKAREMVLDMPYPTASGSVRVPGFAAKLSSTPCKLQRVPPLLGEHTDSILRDVLGLDAAQIATLSRAGAFGAAA